MSFNTYENKEEPKTFADLSVVDKNKITDIYADGGNATKIKHEMFITSAVSKEAIVKIKAIESKMIEVMNERVDGVSSPSSATELKTAMKGIYTSCNVESLEYLIDKIILCSKVTKDADFDYYKSKVVIDDNI